MKKLFSLLQLVLAIPFVACTLKNHQSSPSRVIHVNQTSTSDSKCVLLQNVTLCKTLEQANAMLEKYKDDVTIKIEGNATLKKTFCVSKSTNIVITGADNNMAYVNCTAKAAGFFVERVDNFSFTNITVVNCSMNINPDNRHAAMVVRLSSNVTIKDAGFENCSSTAMIMVNNSGNVSLEKTSFRHNIRFKKRKSYHVNISYPAALSIELTLTRQHYNISHCLFHYNESPQIKNEIILEDKNDQLYKFVNRGYGGAMFIEFGGITNGSSVRVENTNFTSNSGVRGGAVYAYFRDKAHHNKLTFLKSLFRSNHADVTGGGINFGYHNLSSLKNTIYIIDCQFVNNTSLYGGGLAIYSTYSENPVVRSEGPIIVNSTWHSNSAVLSSAVDVAPLYQVYESSGYLPVPKFLNCMFENNSINNTPKKSNRTYHVNTGIFSVTNFKVVFGNKTNFRYNQYSAIVLVSGTIEFQNDSQISFCENIGYNGGAIAMYSFSTIVFNTNSTINFSRNHAINNGGAIYYRTSSQHSFIRGSTDCFLRNHFKNMSLISTTKVNFKNNTAEIVGEDIYAESFHNCYTRCSRQCPHCKITIHKVFKCVGSFSFSGKNNKPYMGSSGRKFRFQNGTREVYAAIPGDSLSLPFHILDDFNNTIKPLLSISSTNDSSVYFSEPFSTSNTISPHGVTNTRSTIRVSAIGVRQIYSLFDINLMPCPPGYHSNKRGSCTCAAEEQYSVILKCENFSATYKGSRWFGYIPENSTDHTNLYFAQCSAPICNESNRRLPREQGNLNSMICASNREGIMCGMCVENHSTYYHSESLACEENRHCQLGVLFYIISEIVPMIIFFIITITFELSFTSGAFVGFVFLAQYPSIISIPTVGLLDYLHMPYRIFYGLFNFEFFNIEQLRFCLWHGAQILDVVVIRYVTILVALLLVLIFIGALSVKSCTKLCRIRRYVSAKTSVVHGLSTFLVICYARCTNTSFIILKYTIPTGYGGSQEQRYTYYGGLHYFRSNHLVYALPALLSLVFVTVLPPLVLLLYPLSLHLLSLCGLSEHWLINKTLQLTGINKLKPFIDCFQSCYKDRLRFFAGLYFVYRVAILVVFSVSIDSFFFSVYSEIFLVFVLGIHATVQPYREPLHNILDGLAFFNLALINGCDVVSKVWLTQSNNPNGDPYFILLAAIQLILRYLPMLVVLFQVGRYGHTHMKQCRRHQPSCQGSSVEVEDILDHTDANHDSIFSSIGESLSRPTYGSVQGTTY